MDLRPLSHTQACVAVQWSDRLWSGQYRQLQPPFCEAASAWVLQMVASTSTYRKPGSVPSALKKTRPNARNRLVPEPGRPRAPVARFRRQIAPRTGPTCPPQDRAEEQSIVRTGPPVITLLARNQRRDDGAWTCRVYIPVSELIYAAFRSNANGLLPPKAFPVYVGSPIPCHAFGALGTLDLPRRFQTI